MAYSEGETSIEALVEARRKSCSRDTTPTHTHITPSSGSLSNLSVPEAAKEQDLSPAGDAPRPLSQPLAGGEDGKRFEELEKKVKGELDKGKAGRRDSMERRSISLEPQLAKTLEWKLKVSPFRYGGLSRPRTLPTPSHQHRPTLSPHCATKYADRH